MDGFRFDLAPVLGRHNHGYSSAHPMLEAIGSDERLRDAKLIAEPWDPGPGGYQLGHFPRRWAEWNDRYRDTVRQFWRGDDNMSGKLAQALRGSADVFEWSGRSPLASVNLVTSHDGFTLADVVSFEHRHNEANGEDNRDGHAHNYSCNHGVEGSTDDPAILATRRRQRLNMLAMLLFSQGTPLILAGDEFGQSQQGNNNAYAQDNETAWLDWAGIDRDPEFLNMVKELIRLRRETPLLRLPDYVHGHLEKGGELIEIAWYSADGGTMDEQHWSGNSELCVVISATARDGGASAVAIAINGSGETRTFGLPTDGQWSLSFASAGGDGIEDGAVVLPGRSLALLSSSSG